MSHQSGIQGTDELQALLSTSAASADTRMIQVLILDETLQAGKVEATQGDEREDYDRCVLSVLEEKECCFILYRLDSKNSNGFDWLFISYNPDWAHIRDKMIYASTRATLKTLFGTTYIKTEIFGTVPDDVSLDGYDKHLVSEAAPAPLSMEEHEKAEVKALEVGVNIGASTKKALVATGVSFPVSEDAMAALEKFKSGSITYVQMSLDGDAEVINLEQDGKLSCEDAAKTTPDDIARFHLFMFQHNHEGDELNSAVFVYSCPSFKMKVKDRMLYSTAKAPLLAVIEQEIGIEVTKKLEIEDGAEFTVDNFYTSIHPPVQVVTQKFARPKGPAGRKGTSRLTGRSSRSRGADAEK
eukprot:m.80815 g.80815  ORF g.80815 m.80815 type:complete len:355 (+) comp16317_c0_seq1:83-1147(+)